MEVPGYRIGDELTRDAHYVVCRAETPDGGPVLLKLSLSPSLHPAAIASLRRAHELLTALDLDGVPRPLAFEPQGALVLEDIGATTLRAVLRSGPLALAEFLWIAPELARTLGAIHARRLIHKSLSPESVLVETGGKRRKIVIFIRKRALPDFTRRLNSWKLNVDVALPGWSVHVTDFREMTFYRSE